MEDKTYLIGLLATLLVLGWALYQAFVQSRRRISAQKQAIRQMQEKVQLVRRQAEAGDARAQYNLGTCYYFGEGVEQDLAEAFGWWRLAAVQGDALSLIHI